jgi:hypothetical protein
VFIGAHEFDVLNEHTEVGRSRDLVRVGHEVEDSANVRVDFEFVVVGVEVVDEREVAVGVFDYLQTAFVVNVGSVLEGRSGCKEPLH